VGLVIAVARPWWKEGIGMVVDRLIGGAVPIKRESS
jgi:hypothetical protein